MSLAATDHINVVVADIELSRRFYCTLFDMEAVLEAELDGAWFERVTGLLGARARCVVLKAREGDLRIELLEYLRPASYPIPAPAGPSTLGLRHFAVRVGDIAHHLAIAARFVDAGVEVVEVPRHILANGKRMCYLTDPDGAMIELAEYPPPAGRGP